MRDGPVIDARTHPLLYPEGQIGDPQAHGSLAVVLRRRFFFPVCSVHPGDGALLG